MGLMVSYRASAYSAEKTTISLAAVTAVVLTTVVVSPASITTMPAADDPHCAFPALSMQLVLVAYRVEVNGPLALVNPSTSSKQTDPGASPLHTAMPGFLRNVLVR